MTRPKHAHMHSDQGCSSFFVTEQNKYVSKRSLNDDSDGAHLKSINRVYFQTKCEQSKQINMNQISLIIIMHW